MLDAVMFCETRAVISGQGGGIAERLIINLRDAAERFDDVVAVNRVLVAGTTEVPVSDARVRQLVVIHIAETDRKRFSGPGTDFAENARDGGAVKAAAKEGARCAVRVAVAHCAAESAEQFALELRERSAACFLEAWRPVTLNPQATIFDNGAGCRAQFADLFEDGCGRGHHVHH